MVTKMLKPLKSVFPYSAYLSSDNLLLPQNIGTPVSEVKVPNKICI